MIMHALAAAAVATTAPQMLEGHDCPDLKSGDPVSAARTSASRGDCHLLMIGGFTGVVPGSEGSNRPYRLIAGTGDDGNQAGLLDRCRVPKPAAMTWAEKYNQTIVELDRRSGGKCLAH
jgi:hypothetical protein